MIEFHEAAIRGVVIRKLLTYRTDIQGRQTNRQTNKVNKNNLSLNFIGGGNNDNNNNNNK